MLVRKLDWAATGVVVFRQSSFRIVAEADVESPCAIFQDMHPEKLRFLGQAPQVGFEPTTRRLTGEPPYPREKHKMPVFPRHFPRFGPICKHSCSLACTIEKSRGSCEERGANPVEAGSAAELGHGLIITAGRTRRSEEAAASPGCPPQLPACPGRVDRLRNDKWLDEALRLVLSELRRPGGHG
jgi:hypothetical protein